MYLSPQIIKLSSSEYHLKYSEADKYLLKEVYMSFLLLQLLSSSFKWNFYNPFCFFLPSSADWTPLCAVC